MNLNHPKSTVVLSLLASGVLISAKEILNKKMPTYRQIFGVFVVYLFLSIGVELTPEFAAMMALLVLVVVFLETFGNIAPNINAFFGGKNAKDKVTTPKHSQFYPGQEIPPMVVSH